MTLKIVSKSREGREGGAETPAGEQGQCPAPRPQGAPQLALPRDRARVRESLRGEPPAEGAAARAGEGLSGQVGAVRQVYV